jgi:ribonuclease HIII
MKFSIGSDECLKGDTFGGIIVAAVATNSHTEQILKQMGVQDSKKIRDDKIPLLANQIQAICPYVIKELFPFEYNQKKQNVTGLLNELHALAALEVREKLVADECVHIVDAYPGCAVGDVRLVKAESAYTCVAAASIVARNAALMQLQALSQSLGKTIPKGSTHVQDMLRYVCREKDPAYYVKLHFSNVRKMIH